MLKIDKLKKYMETDGLIPGPLFRLEIFRHTIAGIWWLEELLKNFQSVFIISLRG